MLHQITPVILTYNEAPNIGRTLSRLTWAQDIVVVDSCSTDETRPIAESHAQVRVHERAFDNAAAQWNHAVHQTGIATTWILALDADYVLPDNFVSELQGLEPGDATAGYEASFVYCHDGRPLRGSAYPPVTVLYRRDRGKYVQDGHTQRVRIDGPVGRLNTPIWHDDRKPLGHWLQSQLKYARLEADKLKARSWSELGWTDRLRLLKVVTPALMPFYCLLLKGNIFDGRAGLYYTLQRTFAELLLSLYLIDTPAQEARGSAVTGPNAQRGAGL